jgi:hypothetical protein
MHTTVIIEAELHALKDDLTSALDITLWEASGNINTKLLSRPKDVEGIIKTLISECIRYAPALHCSYQVMDKNSSQLLLQGDCFLANPENRKPLSYFFKDPADYDNAIHLFLQVFDQDKTYQLQRIAEQWLTEE